MDYLREHLNPRWLAIVGIGLYTQAQNICLIGLCEIVKLHSSYASLIFALSVLCLIAEYRLWPDSLKTPPAKVLFVTEIFVSSLMLNLTMHLVWVPMMRIIWNFMQGWSKLLAFMNETIRLGESSPLMKLSNALTTDEASLIGAYTFAILSFVWMLDATEMLDYFIIEQWAKRHVTKMLADTKNARRIRFKRPLVTDRFIYYDLKTDTFIQK